MLKKEKRKKGKKEKRKAYIRYSFCLKSQGFEYCYFLKSVRASYLKIYRNSELTYYILDI